MQVPEEEKYLMSKDEMLNELVTLFGGRAAEEVKFNSVTTGASNDIERATSVARAMITRYGMSETFGLMGLETVESQYLDGRSVLNCSDQTAAKIDDEVMKVLKDAYETAIGLLKDNMEALDEISHFLIEKETITGKEFMEIFNRISEEKKEKNQIAEKNVIEMQINSENAEESNVEIQRDMSEEKKDSERPEDSVVDSDKEVSDSVTQV